MSAVDTNDLDELVARIFNMAFDFATAATEFARQENARLRAALQDALTGLEDSYEPDKGNAAHRAHIYRARCALDAEQGGESR